MLEYIQPLRNVGQFDAFDGESAATGNIGATIAGQQTNALMTGAHGQVASQSAAGTAFNPRLQGWAGPT